MYKERYNFLPSESERETLKAWVAKTSLAVGTGYKSVQRQNTLTEPLGSIFLHMPNNIALAEEATWGADSLGIVGNLTKGAMKGGEGDVMGSLLGAGVGSAGNVLAAAGGGIAGKILSGIPGVTGWMGGLLGAIGGGTIQKGAEAAFSVSQNPYMEMMFSGIGFRAFKFDFVFRARIKT